MKNGAIFNPNATIYVTESVPNSYSNPPYLKEKFSAFINTKPGFGILECIDPN